MASADEGPLSRAAALTGYPDLCRTLGLDPMRLLREAEVPDRALGDPDLKIPARSVARALELAARRSGAEDFGLRLAEHRRLSNLGVLGLVARDQPDLRHIVEVMGQYLWMQTEGLSIALETAGDLALLRTVIVQRGGRPSRQANELIMGVLCRTMATLAGEQWRPLMVCFTHPAPAGRTCHRRVLGAEPAFDQAFDGVVFDRADLDRPILAADPLMAAQMARFAELAGRERPRRMSERVRELVTLLLPTGQASAERIAEHLALDRRTVSRRLAAEGTSFSDILSAVRLEMAQAQVDGGRRDLTAIADMLGFSALSAFSRWHVQWFGESPTARRRRRNAGA